MLADAALRAARVVVDIGLHILDLPLPDGSRWTFGSPRVPGRAAVPNRIRFTPKWALRGCC
jgi:hypothetical protein